MPFYGSAAYKGRERMNKTRLPAILLTVCIAVSVLSACARAKDPESAVKTFMKAAEELDTAAALRCIAPELRKRYRASLRAAGELAGTGQEKLIPVLVGIPCLDADKGLNYEIRDVSMTDDAHAAVRIRVQINKDLSKEVTIPCIRAGGCWYIGE